ncbi:MAG: DEAD/DEAH box helicase [Acidimicrobiales bacterium]
MTALLDPAAPPLHPALAPLHPAVAAWFMRRFPSGPTPPQIEGWPRIAAGEHTLIAAPTGSGKTLAGFLVCIDALYRAHERGEPIENATQVVYVSPLKALAVDIKENLERPLAEIAEEAALLGLAPAPIRVAVRSGDTSAAERAAMARRPPNFLVTTPESLYLLLTAGKTRAALGTVTTVIVDEIHAVARDKRGSHLALSLERLDAAAQRPPVRIGLSATQRPIERVARLLVGAGPDRDGPGGAPRCAIVDTGHRRALDLAIELPGGELEAVASAEQTGDVLDRIAEHVAAHRTTLVFVNTRRMAERVAHQLGERLGHELVAAHHGSLSKDRRLRVENRLRAGDLRALVATASLELGIDIGPVELVCQLASPRSIATLLQRVGRSGHTRAGTPKGRLYPLTRDELVECCALLGAVRAGRLDAILPPEAPLDILAQQLVAEVAAQGEEAVPVDRLYELAVRAAPFAGLERARFDEVITLVSEGVLTGRGRRAAWLHHDRVNGEVRARRGARLAAVTSGGAIPEAADYRVLAAPDDALVGTVNEDWAIESMAGDVFLLGSTSWRIHRVEPGVVRVVDANGAPPTVPFWLGEAPARTWELSQEVSELRGSVDAALAAGGLDAAEAVVAARCGVDRDAAQQAAAYLAAGRAALGVVPTCRDVVFERFFDESGGMQLVVHAPFGGRINRGLGLALRKRFCRSFDFELQAAANDDAVVLSLGPQHSFPLEDTPRFLRSDAVEATLRQAVLASPMFTARWRWNLNRALIVLRSKGGRKNPPPIQRMEADDLMAAIFPALAACQENAVGPIEIPDHPIVDQTMHDCLHEAMDVAGLEALVRGFEQGEVRTHFVDLAEPSPLAHEILTARPYTFLDDAPLEERRTRSVPLRRGIPVELSEIGRVDLAAIERVRDEAKPDPRNADELHDLLLSVVVHAPVAEWAAWFGELAARGRVSQSPSAFGPRWCAAERAELAHALFGAPSAAADHAAVAAVRGHLDLLGPATAAELAARGGVSEAAALAPLAALVQEGFALEGRWSEGGGGREWCSRRLLARIHAYTRQRQRREVEPVSAQELMRFLLRWQHVAPGEQRQGRDGVLAAIEQLQGFEVAAGAWERKVLAARVARYQPAWLDALCLSGHVAWARLTPRPDAGAVDDPASGADGPALPRLNSPSRATPVALFVREDLDWLLHAARGAHRPCPPPSGAAREVLDALAARGARFHAELRGDTGRLPSEVEDALWDGVARGLVTADGFCAIRSLFESRARPDPRRDRWRRPDPTRLRRAGSSRPIVDGRWALVPEPAPCADADALAEAVAEQLLARWGVVFRDLLARESLALPWREIQWALRRLEARGLIRGGRFVTGFSGEQYAHLEAVEQLKRLRRTPRNGERVEVSAADPLNLVGVILPGPRRPANSRAPVVYVDGAALPAPGG